MAEGKQQNPLRDMITALGSLSEMAHIFYTGMKGGRSLGAGSHLRNEYLHRRHVARIHGGRQREKETR